uniref:Uncharacterized protein n=1 Tax=Setaria digitata TaxID=48799 RepID=A0A915PJ59_9BILA
MKTVQEMSASNVLPRNRPTFMLNLTFQHVACFMGGVTAMTVSCCTTDSRRANKQKGLMISRAGMGGGGSAAVQCGAVRCGVVWCGVVRCGVLRCGVVRCGVVWCGVVQCGVVWCGAVRCGVVRCGAVWCGVHHTVATAPLLLPPLLLLPPTSTIATVSGVVGIFTIFEVIHFRNDIKTSAKSRKARDSSDRSFPNCALKSVSPCATKWKTNSAAPSYSPAR